MAVEPNVNGAQALMTGTKRAPEQLGRVLVLGLGKSGKAAVRYCADRLGGRVSRLFVAAGARTEESEAFAASFESQDVDFAFGDEALDCLEESFDLCIASPGIPFWHQLYVQGALLSTELVSEIEFAWRESAADSTWVAITGTNGKTTVTSCCAAILHDAGLQAHAVGNIGDVCLEAVAAGDTDVYVAEVSSYQLASTVYFAPDVAVLLNITPDHIHWHQTLEAYRDAKFKVLANLGTQVSDLLVGHRAVAVLDATNDVVRAKVRELKALPPEGRGFDYIPLGTKAGITGDMRVACGAQNAAFLDAQEKLHVAYGGTDHVLLPAADLQMPGAHNVSNALAAATAAVVLGVPDESIVRSLASFAPLEHRIEPCGSIAGVTCYNDSKATNVDSTIKALEAFPKARPVVLLGGDDKGTDLSDLVASAHAHTRAAVCYGAGGPRFKAAFEQASDSAPADFVLAEAGHLEDALDCALQIARPGDIVLLSPACASFDEFTSFEERGRVFKKLVRERAIEQGA